MLIKNLKLTNFRNYNYLDVEFVPSINFITGSNGAGKTNVLEAISLLSLGKSFVTSQEINCVKIHEESASIEADIDSKKVKRINLVISSFGKEIAMNGKKINKISDMATKFLTVTFAPKDVRLFKDSPSERRKFINISISMLSTSYIMMLKQYNELIKQRNILLKQEIDMLHILSIDEQIAPLSYEIMKMRKNFINNLEEKIRIIYNCFNIQNLEINLKYETFIPFCENKNEYIRRVLECLKQNYELDLKRKSSSKGIHYDDFVFYLNENDISIIGSQGQNRIATLALKLGVAKLLEELTQEKPILLLDDVLSELDDNFQNSLGEILNNIGQVFITGNEVPKTFKSFTEYNVSNQEMRRK